MRCACATYTLVAGELAVNAMRASSLLTKSFDTICLVSLKVTLKPEPLTWVLVVALPRKDVRSNAVQEPTVVAGYHRASWEALKCILKAFQRLNIEVVGRLVQKQEVSTLLKRKGKV